MARDYRHGHNNTKKGFTRKSQQSSHQQEKRSVSLIWGAGFFVSAVLLVGFFVTQHFLSKGVKSTESTENTIFQSAVALQEATTASIAEVSQKLQPVKIVPVQPVKPVPVQPTQSIAPVESRIITLPTPVIEVAEASSAVETPLEASETNALQQYSFYQGLSQSEVVVDVEPISVKLEVPYYIQAGTFGSEVVAIQEQKRLARLGHTLQISVLHKPERTYYRLRVGPFDDRLTLNKRRNELRRLGVDTSLIKAAKVLWQP